MPYTNAYGKRNLEVKKEILKSGGYIVIPECILHDPSLTPGEKIVFGVLLNFIRPKGRGRCTPRIDVIAAHASVSPRHVRNALQTLREKNWIYTTRTKNYNEYRIFSQMDHDEINAQLTKKRENNVKKSKDKSF